MEGDLAQFVQGTNIPRLWVHAVRFVLQSSGFSI